MTPLPEMLAWVGSHANRFRRAGYEPPNHLANGHARLLNSDGSELGEIRFTAAGATTAHLPAAAARVEIYGGDGQLLFAEDA